MGLFKPDAPPYDPIAWSEAPFDDQLRLACQSWAVQGFGAPVAIYLVYLIKVAVWAWAWVWLVGLSPGIDGGFATVGDWWLEPVAFQKAILWTMVWEGLGLGCGSGPLTGRYVPPVGGFLYFARPGTTRLPPWPDRVPGTAGHTRTWVDVALFLGYQTLLLRALVTTDLGIISLLVPATLLVLLGLRDKTAFLATRPEHYLATLVVFLFAADLIAGSKAVHLAIWWGAATSKLNRHFPYVVTVMVSNSPFLRSRWLKERMYRDFPDDLRPSRIPAWLAHGGTVIEYLVPLALLLSTGGRVTLVGIAIMTAFHLFITLSAPMGVPIEWNVLFVYSMYVLFGAFAEVRIWDVTSPVLAVLLVAALVGLPLLGNLAPRLLSFLPSMRYYAGNWAYSTWLFRGDAIDALDADLTKSSPEIQRQLEILYDDETVLAISGKVLAFRAMHLHGRVQLDLLPRAIADVPGATLADYVYRDGELIAGVVLGWNFGDGHLHDESLLGAVQARCGFASGELRCIFVESQPFGDDRHHWRIVDAADGLVAEGHTRIRDVEDRQPWDVPAARTGRGGGDLRPRGDRHPDRGARVTG